MDSELAEGRGLTASESGKHEKGREDDNELYSRPKSYTERFEETFPILNAMGMSYELFWDGDCDAVKGFIEADKLKQKRADEEAWLHGLYVYEAIGALAPILRLSNKREKAQPYPKEPYSFKDEEKEAKIAAEKERNAADIRFMQYMSAATAHFNQKFKNKEVNKDAGK